MNNQNQKFSILTNISTAAFLAGIVFIFIKAWIGVLCILIAGILNIYTAKKYPSEHKALVKSAQKNTPQSFKLKHLEGINFIDSNSDVNISMPSNKIIISNKNQAKEFLLSDITNAAILEEITKDKKDKSVVARALVGGVLLGGVGAVIGGMSALNNSYKENKNYYLQIKIKSGDDMIFTGKTQNLKTIKEFITKNV